MAGSESTGRLCSPEPPHRMSVTEPASPRPAKRPRVLPLAALAVVLSAAVLAGSLLRPGETSQQIGHWKLQARPTELQRILDGVVTGRDRLAPGATAFVTGPRGTWIGSAGVADVATREAESGSRSEIGRAHV